MRPFWSQMCKGHNIPASGCAAAPASCGTALPIRSAALPFGPDDKGSVCAGIEDILNMDGQGDFACESTRRPA